jgi:uncharacterized protein YkwD
VGNCTQCGRTTTLLVECEECHEEFCEVHRSPTDHDCRSVSTDGSGGYAASTGETPSRDGLGSHTGDPRVLYPEDVASSSTGGDDSGDPGDPADSGDDAAYAPMDFDPTVGITRAIRFGAVLALVLAVGLASAGFLWMNPGVGATDGVAPTDQSSGVGEVLGRFDGAVDSLLGGALPGAGASGGDEIDSARVERLVHEYANRERREAGVDPVEYDAALAEIAAYHSRDMGQQGYVGHTSPDGESITDRFQRFGYACETNGEVIQWLDYDELERTGEAAIAQVIVENWMDSDLHRSFVLDGSWERQGVGVYLADSGRLYVTQNTCSR